MIGTLRRLVLVLLWLALVVAPGVLAQAPVNVALNKPITGTGPTWPGYPPANLTDGDHNTFTHPEANSEVRGYYFQVDLGQVYLFDQIILWSRADGCCPERLTKYRVEVYGDNGGETGTLNWAANLREDGTYPASGASDTITADAHPAGLFAGRFVRVLNNSDAPYNPQLAEIEVFGTRGAQIRMFQADDDALAAGQGTTLRWEVANAGSVSISPDIGDVPLVGSVTVKPATTTIFTLTAKSATGDSTAKLTVGVGVTFGPPVLSEFLAENANGLKDEDGGHPDWIELVNTNAYRMNLEGYCLTDDPAAPAKWRFPAVRVPANGRLVVMASGKDRRDPTAPLHTNFKLDAKGDYLALVAIDGKTVLQQFPADYPTTKAFPKQRVDVSYGIGSAGGLGFMRPPTPGGTNGAAFAGIVADTKFSFDRGFYDTNIAVAITCATPGAVVRYTTDRTEPTAATGTVYSSPVVISNTTVLRAVAFFPDWAPSDVDTQTYLYPSNIIAAANMRTTITKNAVYGPQMRAALTDVPSVSLVTRQTINGTTEVKTSFEWIEPDGRPGVQIDCGVQNFGGAFTDFAKKSFRLYFRSEYGAGKLRYPVFAGFDRGTAPAEEFDQLELRNGSHDMEQRGFYMSNICTDDTLLEMGRLNPHGRFVHLYINGAYWGVYHLRERWGAAMHASYLGGSSTNYESINGNWNVGGWAEPGTAYDGDGSVWTRIKSLRRSYKEVKAWLDVPEYIDYMLMWMFGGSEDEYRSVGPTVPGSGMKFYLNDADGWFCGPWYCAADDRTGRGSPGRAAGDGPGSLFSMLYAEGDPEYRILLADQIHRALSGEGALTQKSLTARLNLRAAEVTRPFYAESARWNYLTPATWASRRDYALTNWLTRRTGEVAAQWRSAGFYPALNAPSLNRDGGIVPKGHEVRFTGPASGTIYFTTDGRDPRLVGGAVSPTARSYSTGGTNETLVEIGSVWRWYTDAAGLGSSVVVAGSAGWGVSNWKHPAFNDAAWKSGPAQLGYGENDEATVIPYGADASKKWVTSYFRRAFRVDDTNRIESLTLRLKRDDGAIVYLNGIEAGRSSIPDGEVTGTSLATGSPDDGQIFNPLAISPALLVPGTNVIAVELHQSSITTSDASFDLELVAVRTSSASGDFPVVDRNTVVKARARSGNTWSALHTAFFQVGDTAVGAGDVRVTEMNFNPAGPDDSEFVELANLSDHAVNLRSCRFTNGIDFAFSPHRDLPLAPGERLVLVNDLFGFQQRYGTEIPVAGIFTGSLDNGGEEIAFVGAQTNLITRFQYDGAKPWPVDSDGKGYTLVLANPALDPSNPEAWRASSTTNGTPGGVDAVVFTGDPGVDADGDGFVALIEYALGTSDSDGATPGRLLPELDALGNVMLTLGRNLAADDVVLWVETSTDLVAWTEAPRLSSRVISPGLAREVWGVPLDDAGRRFLRVSARLNR